MMKKTLCLVAAAGFGATAATADTTVTTGATADEVRAIVADMLSDADTRSSLLQGGGSAGWDDGFFIESGDGSFRLNVGAMIQFRYVASFRDDGDGPGAGAGGEDDFDADFQNRYTRLSFSGTLFDDWFYKVQTNFSDMNGGFSNLEDAYAGYKFEDGAGSVSWGQGKTPLTREELVDEGHQLAIDSSLVNEYFNGGRTQGVVYGWDSDEFRGTIGLTDGFRQANSDLGSAGFGQSDFALTARGEFLISGNWDQFEDFTSANGSEEGFMIGAAVHFQTGPGDVVASDADILVYTVDASYEADGWNLFAAFVGSNVDPDAAGSVDSDDYGIVLQGGVYLNDDTELYGRYSQIFFDDNTLAPGSEDTNSEWVVGVNHYLHGHAAKLSLDFVYYGEESVFGGSLGSAAGNTNIGRLGDDDEGEFAVRAQMQLMF